MNNFTDAFQLIGGFLGSITLLLIVLTRLEASLLSDSRPRPQARAPRPFRKAHRLTREKAAALQAGHMDRPQDSPGQPLGPEPAVSAGRLL